jgi:uncharacterized protein YpmB
MKKIFYILIAASLLVMCKSASTAKKADTKATTEVRYRDDFKTAPDAEKSKFLKSLKATGESYSVLVLTQNYKGEKITVTNGKTKVYADYPLSDPKKGLAANVRINNTMDTKVYDDLTKKEVLIESKEAKKHKFIYLMKNPGGENTFILTYSNTLRPMD